MKNRRIDSHLEDFEAEALTHLDALLRTATRVSGNSRDGEDIVQETYLRAWKYFDSFEKGTNCRAWLFGIMFNVINARRGKQAKFAASRVEDDEYAHHQRSNVVAFDPLKQIQAREVLEAANQLRDEHRAVLRLVVVEEFSYREAAEILEVPIGTVMSRLHRARRELHKRLMRDRAGGVSL